MLRVGQKPSRVKGWFGLPKTTKKAHISFYRDYLLFISVRSCSRRYIQRTLMNHSYFPLNEKSLYFGIFGSPFTALPNPLRRNSSQIKSSCDSVTHASIRNWFEVFLIRLSISLGHMPWLCVPTYGFGRITNPVNLVIMTVKTKFDGGPVRVSGNNVH